jgi:hypothetical protein
MAKVFGADEGKHSPYNLSDTPAEEVQLPSMHPQMIAGWSSMVLSMM